MINFIHIPKNGGSSIKKIIQDSDNIQIKYFKHSVGKTFPENNIFVIIREPIDRFCSSVSYTLSHTEKRKTLSHCKLLDPESWVKCMMDTEHPYRNILFDMLLNNITKFNSSIQFLCGEKLQYQYIYSPQSLWLIKQPRFMLLFDNIQKEFEQFTEYFFKKRMSIPHTNKSKNINNLSSKSIDFLTNFYNDDIKMYKKYSAFSFMQRINMDEKM